MWMAACLGCLVLGYMASFESTLAKWTPESMQLAASRDNMRLEVETRAVMDAPGDLGVPEPHGRHYLNHQGSRSAGGSISNDNSNSTSEEVGSSQAEEDRYASGVIMSLHNGIVSMGVSLIRELRCLGNDEVIQVYHCFPDEMSDESRAVLTRNDPRVEVIDVCTELLADKDAGWFHQSIASSFKSYWLKPLALHHTKIREVILLDADAVLMRNPADLRALSGYKRTGTTFFYDRVVRLKKFLNGKVNGKQLLHELIDSYEYNRVGLEGPKPSDQLKKSWAYLGATGHEMDSSLLLIDKTRAGKALDVLRDLFMRVRMGLRFSWGDKEAFWLAYELAHMDYFFSPYGLSLIDSVPNGDMQSHPNTLCGSMAHFVPTEDPNSVPEVLYVNGKALLEPFPLGVDKTIKAVKSRMFNLNPTHITPRHVRSEMDLRKLGSFECMNNLGSVELPRYFYERLMRRRSHFFAAETKFYEPLNRCE